MTCKPPLYAFAAVLTITWAQVGTVPAADAQPLDGSISPPCGACVRTLARPPAWRAEHADVVALLLMPQEVGADEALVKAAHTVLVEIASNGSIEETSFRARRALVALRAANADARLGVVAEDATLHALLSRDLAAYVDLVVFEQLSVSEVARLKQGHPGLSLWSTFQFESFGSVVDAGDRRPPGVDAALIWPPLTSLDSGFLAALRLFADLFPENLIPVPDFPPRCEPAAVCGVATFQRADTLETLAVVRRTTSGSASVSFAARTAEMFVITARGDSEAGPNDTLQPLAPPLAGAGGEVRFAMPVGAVSHLLVRLPTAGERVTENVSVVGARSLAVEEIVARHQSVAARQARTILRLVTDALTTLTFEVPAFPAPVTIQAATTIFQGDGPTELVQRSIAVNGVPFTSSDVPRLPLIEPERVAAPPLTITLDRTYRYRLTGRERVRDRDAYVVSFEPVDSTRSLFRGSAWIDAERFALLRVDAVQTNLRGPITSSQQIEEFAPQKVGGQTFWLLQRSEIRQIYQGAGITTPIHRLMVVRRHTINPPDLAARRAQAYGSPAVMLRETPDGLRYLRRDRHEGRVSGEPQVAGRATRVRTVAGGVLIDPNITRPLPFAGLNYTDFDFLGTGTQLNAFYAGSYGQFAFNAPSLGGTRWQLTGSGFGILAHYNDRSFRAGVEHYEENLRQRPANLRAGIVRPLTARTTLRGEYALDYVALERASTTAASFGVPADQVVHAARLALETQRGGWRLEAWWNPARRTGWREWGRQGSDDFDPAHVGFQRVGVSAYRPWVLSPRLLARVEAAWMAGRDLDRFSRYAFGSFDNRLRGYPSASIRYDRGGALRSALVWQPGARLRIDGFFDAALVRDPGFGSDYRAYPGVGAALEGPGPWSLLLGAEWGYGIEGRNSDGTRGTHVVRLTAYKVF